MFEVRDGQVREREVRREIGDGELVLSYRRGEFMRETRIAAPPECEVSRDGFRWRLSLLPAEERRLAFEVSPTLESRQAGLSTRTHAHWFEVTRAELRDDLAAWMDDAPTLETDWDELDHLYTKSLEDLAALRCFPETVPGALVSAPRS
jgi:hypothetical protein